MKCTDQGTLRERVRGFSLIELIVVVAIVGILMSMGFTALSRGKTVSKQAVCRGNLKQISLALALYYNDHKAYPGDNLPESLAPYVAGDRDLFICPADPDPRGDSYSRFYVSRTDQSTQNYVCGCPWHVDETSAVTLFSSSSAELFEMQPVQWNGQEVRPGTSVSSGVMTFGDGSHVTIPSGMVVRLIQSFRMHDGRFYSLVGVDVNEVGTLNIEVTPGSRFEVVTPAAIAGVQGTRFQVTCYIDGELYCVQVDVDEGKVEVTNRWKDEPPKVLSAGQERKTKLHRAEMCKKLPKKWKLRRKHFYDDYLYEGDDDAITTSPGVEPT